jgi:hypothetical protein
MTRHLLTDEHSASCYGRRCRGLMIPSRINIFERTYELDWLGRRDCNQSVTPFA